VRVATPTKLHRSERNLTNLTPHKKKRVQHYFTVNLLLFTVRPIRAIATDVPRNATETPRKNNGNITVRLNAPRHAAKIFENFSRRYGQNSLPPGQPLTPGCSEGLRRPTPGTHEPHHVMVVLPCTPSCDVIAALIHAIARRDVERPQNAHICHVSAFNPFLV